MRDNDALASVLLTTRMLGDGVEPLKASEYWQLVEAVKSPGELLGASEERLAGDFGLGGALAARIVALLDRATGVAFALDDLDQKGVSTLTSFDDAYPTRLLDRLATKAPPVLHAVGNLALRGAEGLGVVGRRDVSDAGGKGAGGAARVAARLGIPVVSGGARGVDQLSMGAAAEAGGTVVGYLADALLRTIRSGETRRVIGAGNTVLCTPYSPDAPFSAGSAMGRNKLIYAHSRVTLVVASDKESGGTWAGAVEALRGSFCRVAVWTGDGAGPGNEELERRGATPIDDVNELVALLAAPELEPAPLPATAAGQTSLLDSSG